MSSLIEFKNVSLNFGGVNALTEVSFEISENSLFSIIFLFVIIISIGSFVSNISILKNLFIE